MENSTNLAKAAALFLVDDHAMVREGLVAVLQQAGFSVCGQAGSLAETLSHPQLPAAHLAVVDIALGEDNGVDLVRRLHVRGLPALVYSMHEDSNVVRKAFAAGAVGYVTKREVASCLVEAVRSVLAGKRYVSPRAGAGLVEGDLAQVGTDPTEEFSEQQRRLYELLGEGLSAEDIAAAMRVSPRTVESYAARMIEKLDISGMKDLRRRAIADRWRQPRK